jgi:putative membrane protein
VRLIVRLIILMFSVWATVQIIPGLAFDGSIWALAGIAIVVGAVNAFVRPILHFFSLPLTIVTLGLFALVVNALSFWLAIWIAGPRVLDLGLTTTGFWPTFWGAIVMSIIGAIVNFAFKDSR